MKDTFICIGLGLFALAMFVLFMAYFVFVNRAIFGSLK